jgi:hypothetical protein
MSVYNNGLSDFSVATNQETLDEINSDLVGASADLDDLELAFSDIINVISSEALNNSINVPSNQFNTVQTISDLPAGQYLFCVNITQQAMDLTKYLTGGALRIALNTVQVARWNIESPTPDNEISTFSFSTVFPYLNEIDQDVVIDARCSTYDDSTVAVLAGGIVQYIKLGA